MPMSNYHIKNPFIGVSAHFAARWEASERARIRELKADPLYIDDLITLDELDEGHPSGLSTEPDK